MTIDTTTPVRKSDHQVSCDLNGEVAILNLKSSLYFGLNDVGAVIWDSLDEVTTAGDLCKIIMDRFQVDAARCEADVLELLSRLNEAGLIEVSDCQIA